MVYPKIKTMSKTKPVLNIKEDVLKTLVAKRLTVAVDGIVRGEILMEVNDYR